MIPLAATSSTRIQDSSAIKGPGRVDYFMGTGKVAGDRAGVTGGKGQHIILLKQ